MSALLEERLALIPERVALGMKFMEERYPGFKPNKEDLDLNSACCCILGQAAQSREGSNGYEDYMTEIHRQHITNNQATKMGMHPDLDLCRSESNIYLKDLRDEWRRVLPD